MQSRPFRAPALALGVALLSALGGGAALAEEVNIYSARHYDVDQALYDDFAKLTGIKVNVIEGQDDQLIERIRNESGASPADVLITVDAGRLWRAQDAGILQPIHSKLLEDKIPPHLREPNGYWFGISKRARILVYNKDAVDPAELQTYEDLADPKWEGRLLARSSNSVYNQSLVGSMIAADGAEATETWARAVVKNMARTPQGGDIDQIKAVAAGEGDVAISNSYYFARIAASTNPEEAAVANRLGVIFPNQNGRGTHVNVSGAGVLKNAPHLQAAIRFMEYLVSPSAQDNFTELNYEYPIVSDVPPQPVVASWGPFKEDALNAAVYGQNNPEALRIMDRVGWK